MKAPESPVFDERFKELFVGVVSVILTTKVFSSSKLKDRKKGVREMLQVVSFYGEEKKSNLEEKFLVEIDKLAEEIVEKINAFTSSTKH